MDSTACTIVVRGDRGVTCGGIAVILSGFPRASETFALQELLALDGRGLLTHVFATKHGDGSQPQPDVDRLVDRVTVLGQVDPTGQACEVARRLARSGVSGIHGYFAHAPAAVAQLAARIMGLPFGFSMHARDARKVPKRVLHRRARGAACVVACNGDVMREMDGSDVPVEFVPHGVDLNRFRRSPKTPSAVPVILAVGRLVEKKGFLILLDAVARLGLECELRIVGDGPQRPLIEKRSAELGLGAAVTLCGQVTHETLAAAYADADVVVVPSIVDRSGDRDGLPNVVLEAMASGCAVVATRTGAIGSAIRSSEMGELVEAGDPVALSRAIRALLEDAERREAMGRCARERVERCYALSDTTSRFCDVVEVAYG